MKKIFFLGLSLFFLSPLLLYGQEGYHNNPKPILATNFINTDINVNDIGWADPLWTSKICAGKVWLANDPPKYEWTPIINPRDEHSSIVGLSGVALYCHNSEADVPFTHPFGLDYGYLIVPDKNFENLLGPSNGITNEERNIASSQAKNNGIQITKGYLGVEQEGGLIPNEYRVQNFSRVAVFGRWIVDCAHDNFLTEIHPPLLTAFAQAGADTNVIATLDNMITRSKIISLPYLVSQDFENGSLRTQIAGEVSKVKIGLGPLIPLTHQMKAKPTIKKPFSGIHIFQYTLRPPVIPDALLGIPHKYDIYVEYHFTVRDGITIQIAPDGTDGVLVTVLMNDVNYQMDESILNNKRRDWKITPAVIGEFNGGIETVYNGLIGETFAADPDPVKAGVLSKGFLSDKYEPLTILESAEFHKGFIKNLSGNTNVAVDNLQPFPIYGWINVGWKEPQISKHILSSPLNTNISEVYFTSANISKTQLITITNPSGSPVQIGQLSMEGVNAKSFHLQNKVIKMVVGGGKQENEDCSNTTLGPYSSCSLRIACLDTGSPDPKILNAALHIPASGYVDLVVPIQAQQVITMGARPRF